MICKGQTPMKHPTVRNIKVAICASFTVFFILSALNVQWSPVNVEAQNTPEMYVDPQLTVTTINATVSVDISVSDVSDLCSWQVSIYFLNQILEASSFHEGPFLSSHGPTLFDGNIINNFNATHGKLWMYCLRTWVGHGVDGSGTLAAVTFNATRGGQSFLNLQNTILGDSTAQDMTHTTGDGTVQVGADDVAVVAVIPCKTVVCQGYGMRINVTVANVGEYPETFDVTAYANSTAVQTQTVILDNGTSTVLNFTWTATGFVKGNYTSSAYAWPVPGESNTANNNLTGGWFIVSMVGDITGTGSLPDGKCDAKDVALVASLFGVNYPNPRYNPNCDIVYDGKINAKDVALVASTFGKKDP